MCNGILVIEALSWMKYSLLARFQHYFTYFLLNAAVLDVTVSHLDICSSDPSVIRINKGFLLSDL